ncbi:hypothetical protein [Streptomyces sp. NPDC006368]|uniref:hypothetical protein n=1 Tax=Streptomyces sp. NPDC006368 TaxID=3156760 RepID=UPI0033B36633
MSATNSEPQARMPVVSEPSKTEHIAQDARRRRPTDEHWSDTRIFSYVELLRDRYDSPLYVGVAGRPAILLRLSGRMRADLDGLGKLIRRAREPTCSSRGTVSDGREQSCPMVVITSHRR